MENQTVKLSNRCGECEKRLLNNQKAKAKCKKCNEITKFVKETNDFIDTMNEKYQSNCPKFEIVT